MTYVSNRKYILLASLLLCFSAVPHSGAQAGSDIAIVTTPAELVQAINVDGYRHVVIRSHMNVTMEGSLLSEPLLRLNSSTKSIHVRCLASLAMPPHVL